MKTKTVLILVNKQTTIVNFRLEVVEAFVKAGYNVFVSVPEGDRINEIEAVGAKIIPTPMDKDGTDPIKDFLLMLKYRRMIKETKADIVLTYTIKPNVYGGMAAASKNVPYVANITGLGTALENPGKLQKLAILLYKIGLCKVSKVFFQNNENKEFFEKHKIAIGKHERIPGSGVNLEKFAAMEYPSEGRTDFAFISRIRKEKGIEQYIDAAKAIKKEYPETYFHVCGFGDDYYEHRMEELNDEGVLIYHGLLNDVRVMLKDAHCVIHPTYYPEGMSNVLLESSACARPIISTDRAGCREAIDDGENGYLIEEKSSEDLIKKVRKFMELSYEEKRKMGIKGRAKVEKEFGRQIIIDKYLETAKDLIK